MRVRDYTLPLGSPLQKPMLGAQFDRSHSLSFGQNGCWLANEACGDTLHDIGRAPQDSTLGAGVTWAPSIFGPALSFPGSTTGIATSTPNTGINGVSFASVSAWVNTNTLSGGGSSLRYIAAIEDTNSSSNSAWSLRLNASTSKFQLVSFTGATATICNAAFSAVNTWYHLVGTISLVQGARVLNLYINGLLSQSTIVAIALGGNTSNKFLTIGNVQPDTTRSWSGLISHVQVWNRILSPIEVMELYLDPFITVQRPMQAWVRSAPIRGYFISPWPNYEDLSLTEDL